ncbi:MULTISPECIES: VOC family protein [Rhizobium/Agrobacterium group]|uniref:VOC family protein n=1 Tax=Rhizobium/Agrobacterium group TaxID=227290 RepID=UPI000FD7E943|nr:MULTISPECIES: VOC family protein [Rhizobium/Agrobacterium group]RVT69221.1 VOC family protein [Agrobacterium sp. CNPSo 2736]WHO77351.1 VOC family protein [Rhizobium sp. BT03]
MEVSAIDHLVINVTDVERPAAWYVQVLGMKRLEYGSDRGHPRKALMFGSQRINLRPVAITKQEWLTADYEAPGSDDLCFLTTSSPQAVVAHLKECGIEIVSGPDRRDGARGVLHSVYCRDPDGSLIEISSYAV